MRGWLVKEGHWPDFWLTWRSRWCVINADDGTLEYYRAKNKGPGEPVGPLELRGTVRLAGCSVMPIEPSGARAKGRPHVFFLSPEYKRDAEEYKQFTFAAPDNESRAAWITAVKTVADRPKDEAEAEAKVRGLTSAVKQAASALLTKQGKVWGDMSWMERFDACAQVEVAPAAAAAAAAGGLTTEAASTSTAIITPSAPTASAELVEELTEEQQLEKERAAAARVLREACRGNNRDEAMDALGRGADPNGEAGCGEPPPLCLCASHGGARGGFKDTEEEKSASLVARELLKAGAEPNTDDGSGRSALICAALAGHAKTAQLLLGAGARPDTAVGSRVPAAAAALEMNGWTAVHAACHAQSAAVLRLLLKAGATAEPPNTPAPVLMAARVGNAQLIELLLEAGASLDATGPAGETAESVAADGGHTYLAGWLRKRRLEHGEVEEVVACAQMARVALRLYDIGGAPYQEAVAALRARIVEHINSSSIDINDLSYAFEGAIRAVSRSPVKLPPEFELVRRQFLAEYLLGSIGAGAVPLVERGALTADTLKDALELLRAVVDAPNAQQQPAAVLDERLRGVSEAAASTPRCSSSLLKRGSSLLRKKGRKGTDAPGEGEAPTGAAGELLATALALLEAAWPILDDFEAASNVQIALSLELKALTQLLQLKQNPALAEEEEQKEE